MTKHYLKVALRNLSNYKTQTIISVASIGVSVAIFSIISTFILNINGDPLLRQDYVKDAVLMYLRADGDTNGMSFGTINSSDLSGSQFNSIEKIFLPDHEKKSVTVSGDTPEPASASTLRVDPDFLAWGGYESAITNKTARTIANDEVIISEKLGDKLFGNYKYAPGKQIKVLYNDEDNSELRTYTVVDVVASFSINDNKLPDGIGIFHSDDFSSDHQSMMAYIQLRPGKSLNDVADELIPCLNVSPSDINLWRYEAWAGKSNLITTIISRAIMFFLYMFVIVSLSSALRQWLQLFAMRHREVAIRKSLGSKKTDIFRLLMAEEMISMVSAVVVTLVCNVLVFSFLENNFQEVIDAVGFNKPRVFLLTGGCYLSIIAICIMATIYAVDHISPDRGGLALQMKPSKHKLRNIGICLQLIISIVFLSITAVFAIGLTHIEEQMGIPADKSRYEGGLVVRADRMSESGTLQVAEGLSKLRSVAHIMNATVTPATLELADSTVETPRMYLQENNDVVDFHDLNVHRLAPGKSLTRYVLVDEEIKDKMNDVGEWDSGKAIINGDQYEIAGWYERMPFCDRPSIIVTDPAKNKIGTCHFYILPYDGMARQAKSDVKELMSRIAPERFDAYPKDLSFELLGEYNSMKSVCAIIYIMLGISMMTTVATIYAAISLDTRRRRKEMALRKINGAKSKDICRIFAKTYMTIMGISILIALPLSWMSIEGLNETFGFETSPLITSFTALTICVAAVAATLFRKIRDVMNVDPVTYLKD